MQAQGGFSIGEVAAMVGVSAHTLRAWERRHDVIVPLRTAKNQRRYSADDVRFLAQVSETCSEGVRSVKQAVMSVKGLLAELPGPAVAEIADDQPLWREVLDRSADMVLIVDVRGKIVDANRALTDAVGRAREALQGRKASSLVIEGQGETCERAATAPFAPIEGLELQLKTATRVRPVVFQCRPVRQADDWFQVFIGRSGPIAA